MTPDTDLLNSKLSRPRIVALIPEGLSNPSGGSTLASRLLASWNPDDIAELRLGVDVTADDVATARSFVVAGPVPGTLPSLRHAWRYICGQAVSLDRLFVARLTKTIVNWIESFSPELIYVHTGHPWIMKLGMKLARHCDVPLVTHSMDDHYNNFPSRDAGNISSAMASRSYKATFRRCVAGASLNLAISKPMAGEYAANFGASFVPVTPFVAQSSIEITERDRSEYRRRSLVYAGSLMEQTHLGALLALIEAVKRTNERAPGEPWTLDVLTGSIPTEISRDQDHDSESWVRFRQPVDQAGILALVPRYHFALVLMNDDSRAKRYARLSLPSKIPELLASNVPILYIGPTDLGFAKILVESGGAIATTPSVSAIENLLVEIGELDDEERSRLVASGRDYYRTHFSDNVESRFVELLTELVS